MVPDLLVLVLLMKRDGSNPQKRQQDGQTPNTVSTQRAEYLADPPPEPEKEPPIDPQKPQRRMWRESGWD